MGTTAEKLSYLNDTKTLLRTKINNLSETLITTDDTFRSYANFLDEIYNDYPKVTDEGTDISLSNTKSARIDTSLSGQTEQDSTTGKNLFDKNSGSTQNGGTKTINGEKISITGQNGFSGVYWDFDVTGLSTINVKGAIISGAYSKILVLVDGSSKKSSETIGNFDFTISLSSNTLLRVILYGNKGSSLEEQTTSVYEDVMVSTSGGDYEPYTNGPAPNPSYPYPINKATGNQNVLIQNKNLVNQNNAEINKKIFSSGAYTSPTGTNTTDYIYIGNFTNITIIHDGTDGNWNTCYFDENKNVVSGGGNGYSNSKQIFSVGDKKYIKFSYATTCQPALYGDLDISTYEPHQEQNYPITMGSLEAYDTDEFMQNSGKNLISSVARSNNVLYFNGSNENIYPFKAGTYTISYSDTNNCSLYYKTANTSSTSLGQNKTVTFTINEDFNIWLYRSGMIDNEVTNIMLNEGSTALPYEPYGTNEWYLKSNWKLLTLNGTENWNYSTNILYLTINERKASTTSSQNIYCTNYSFGGNYTSVANANNYMSNYQIGTNNNGTSKNIFIKDTDYTSADDFKTYLAEHNLPILIELEAPSYTKITDTTLIGQLNALKNNARSYKDTTNITVTGDLPLVVNAKALKKGDE